MTDRPFFDMLSQVGGIPGVLKYLMSKGLLHGECMTVTGETLQRC